MCSAYQDNMHVTVRAKCMLYAYQSKGRMYSACMYLYVTGVMGIPNRQVTCIFHITNMSCFMLEKCIR